MTGYGMPKKLAFSFIRYGARDHARVPMAWDDSVNGGFNEGQKTWQCVNPAYREINVKKDLESAKSIYRFYQKVLAIRRTEEAAVYGITKEYDHNHRRIIAYSRTYHQSRLFVCGNFSAHAADYRVPAWAADAEVLLNNYETLDVKGRKIRLQPYQAVIFRESMI
jgi:oligo-1,6-glucosidase